MVQDSVQRETSALIAADRVEGTAVYDMRGDKVGAIETVMIDKLTGKVAYAVLSFGGFLGIGERYHPLPWSVLRFSTELGGYVVDIDKQTLLDAPTYGPNEMPNYGDRGWAQRLHDYYRAQVYWD
jgi:sporulation protein YlmC with PRC-barrel domain